MVSINLNNTPLSGVAATQPIALIGVTEFGATNTPTLVYSWSDFVSKFGGLMDGNDFPLYCKLALEEGITLLITRVEATGSLSTGIINSSMVYPIAKTLVNGYDNKTITGFTTKKTASYIVVSLNQAVVTSDALIYAGYDSTHSEYKNLTVAGDQTAGYLPTTSVTVVGTTVTTATPLDGNYTVIDSSYDGTNTLIRVNLGYADLSVSLLAGNVSYVSSLPNITLSGNHTPSGAVPCNDGTTVTISNSSVILQNAQFVVTGSVYDSGTNRTKLFVPSIPAGTSSSPMNVSWLYGDYTYTVDGDMSLNFNVDTSILEATDYLTVTGSDVSANNKTYKVLEATYDSLSDTTTIKVYESIEDIVTTGYGEVSYKRFQAPCFLLTGDVTPLVVGKTIRVNRVFNANSTFTTYAVTSATYVSTEDTTYVFINDNTLSEPDSYVDMHVEGVIPISTVEATSKSNIAPSMTISSTDTVTTIKVTMGGSQQVLTVDRVATLAKIQELNLISKYVKFAEVATTFPILASTTLTGGVYNYGAIGVSEYTATLPYLDPYDVSRISAPAFIAMAWENELASYCASRVDMVGVCAIPDLTPSDAIDYRNRTGIYAVYGTKVVSEHLVYTYGGIDTTHKVGTVITPIRINSIPYYISGAAKTDTNFYQWYAVAGSRIPLPTSVSSISFDALSSGNALLTKAFKENGINSLAKTDTGFILYGNYTAADYGTVLSKANIMLMFVYMIKALKPINISELFNPNDADTWLQLLAKVKLLLEYMKTNRALSKYVIVADTDVNNLTINTPSEIINGQYKYYLVITPIGSLEDIVIGIYPQV